MTAAPASLRSAEEVAREMVSDPGEGAPGEWRFRIRCGGAWTESIEYDRQFAQTDVAAFRAEFAALIEQARADGAAAERERLRNASPIALHKPTEVRVGQVWRNRERGRDVEVSSVVNGIAKFGPNGDIMCAVEDMLELDAWLFLREPHGLAGRVRALCDETLALVASLSPTEELVFAAEDFRKRADDLERIVRDHKARR